MAFSYRFVRLLFVATIIMMLVLLGSYVCYLQVPIGDTAKEQSISEPIVRPFDIHVSSQNCKAITKWVVTTSNTSTPSVAVHVILNSTQDWCILVLGKVASVKYDFTWTRSASRLIYLPLETLSSLPYKLATLPSLDVRNIGYLYAIANGARVVLDLEEGIIPIPVGVNHTYLPLLNDKREYPCPHLEEKEGGVVWNPYPHFGGGHMWPRGFPQSNSAQVDTAVGSRSCYPIIQQYLSQSHPDLDASLLARSESHRGFFINASALVIPRGVFAPYNSHSTIHLHEALWSLLLPKTVHKRVADIWRSYIAQSLFYLIPDACLMFTPPAVTGHMTEPLYYSDELPLYKNSTLVVNLLKYHLMSFEKFEEALLGIYKLMHQSQLLGKDDVTLVEHWISDLKLVGYEFPKLPKKANLWTKKVHLCVMFNWGSTEYRTRQLLSYYMRFFDNITLFLEGDNFNHNYIPSHIQIFHVKTHAGYFQQRCVELCINQIVPNTDSHLFISDDMFINISRMTQLSLSKIWFIPLSVHTFGVDSSFNDWYWWDKPLGGYTEYKRFVTIINGLPQEWKQVLIDKVGFPNTVHGHAVADIVHIPNAYGPNVTKVLNYINSVTDLFCEIAIPLALDIAQPIGREVMEEGNLWEKQRTESRVVQNIIETRYYMHPLKTSTRFGADLWCESMNNQLRLFY